MNSNCGKAAVTLSEESVILHRLFESETNSYINLSNTNFVNKNN